MSDLDGDSRAMPIIIYSLCNLPSPLTLNYIWAALTHINCLLMQTERRILDLEHGTVESCGSKAAACAELARLAEKGDGFSTPSGICLPFGNMEYAIEVIDPDFPALSFDQAP